LRRVAEKRKEFLFRLEKLPSSNQPRDITYLQKYKHFCTNVYMCANGESNARAEKGGLLVAVLSCSLLEPLFWGISDPANMMLDGWACPVSNPRFARSRHIREVAISLAEGEFPAEIPSRRIYRWVVAPVDPNLVPEVA